MGHGRPRTVIAVGIGVITGALLIRGILGLPREGRLLTRVTGKVEDGERAPAADTGPVSATEDGRKLADGILWLWTLPTTLLGHAVGRLLSHQRSRRIGSVLASGHLYTLPAEEFLGRSGCMTLGDVIVCTAGVTEGAGSRQLLSHELAHVRQHRLLGPFYLPAHALAQVVSMGLHRLYPIEDVSPQHSRNPLEEQLLAVPYSMIRHPGMASPEVAERFGV